MFLFQLLVKVVNDPLNGWSIRMEPGSDLCALWQKGSNIQIIDHHHVIQFVPEDVFL